MNNKTYMFGGRMQGRSTLFDKHFREVILLTMKEGQILGIPLAGGIAIFEFKGIKKPKPAAIGFKDKDAEIAFDY